MSHTTECGNCGSSATSRCGGCRSVFYCSSNCQRSHWRAGHRTLCKPVPAPSSGLPELFSQLAAQIDASLPTIHRQGWCIIKADSVVAALFRQLFAQWRLFFALPAKQKDSFRTPLLHGYMTPYPGLHEVFEHKRVNRDPAFKCPAACVEVTEQVFSFCEQLALLALRIMLQHLASKAGHSSWVWSDSDFPPDSTLRLLHYDAVTNRVPEQKLLDTFVEHTDSSLITVAPKSTMGALEMKRFDTGDYECVEDAMQANDVVIFVGDCGAYLTNNYFPSPLHRPSVSRMLKGQVPGSRVSTPFFLRSRASTVLDPAKFVSSSSAAPPPLTVEQIDSNLAGCRDRMPWKLLHSYYSSLRYS